MREFRHRHSRIGEMDNKIRDETKVLGEELKQVSEQEESDSNFTVIIENE
jgi:hypothetical protein